MRALLVVALLATLTLAGCANGPKEDATPTSSTSSSSASFTGASTSSTTTTSSSTTTTTAAPAPKNQAPTARLDANATSGLAPLRVQFTLGGSDPDGNPLTYTLSLGDGSAPQTGSLPATVNHIFTAAGNYTVRLGVSDGKLASNASVTVSALAGAGLPPPVKFNGTASGICQVPDPTSIEPDPSDPFTLLDFEFACLPEGAVIQHNFTMPLGVTKIVANLTWKFDVPAVTDLDLYILNQTGEEVARSGCANISPVPNPEIPGLGPYFTCVRGTSEEAILEGIALTQPVTWTAVIIPYQAPMVPYTLTITYS